MIKVSIVIPLYNSSKIITKVLDSVFNQTFNVFEVILINDCSIDDTIYVINNYIYEKSILNIKFINLIGNRGVSFCRNLGWNVATGDYIAFLDSDDFWNKNKLEIMVKILRNKNIDMVGHAYNEKNILVNNLHVINYNKLRKITFFEIMLKNKFQTSCVIIKKNILERFDETISHCEDYELFVRLVAKNYSVYYYNEDLTYLGRPQLSKGGLSEKKNLMRLGEIKSYQSGLKIKKMFYLFPLMVLFSFFKFLLKIFR